MKKLKVIDLFAGVGGLSYGFSKNPNFKIIAANELLYDMATAYSLNHPEVKVYNSDVRDFGIKQLHEDLRPKSGYGNTYCKLWWDKPSTTITRNLGTPSSSRCIHPKAARALTTREGARLQGFPDDYKFYGSRTNRNLQIGNAVPTQLSKALADAVSNYFAK